jgi:hypothetical protein
MVEPESRYPVRQTGKVVVVTYTSFNNQMEVAACTAHPPFALVPCLGERIIVEMLHQRAQLLAVSRTIGPYRVIGVNPAHKLQV